VSSAERSRIISPQLKQNDLEFFNLPPVSQFQFWERRAYAAEINTRGVAEQKLDYIHENPCHDRWQLATAPEKYFFSSARFYLLNIDEFGFITHYAEHI